MADGTEKAIAAIRTGESVMAFDGLGALTPRRVARTFVHEDNAVMEVAGVKATAIHRFLTEDGEWVSALRLRAGQAIATADGGAVPYAGPRPVAGRHTVHNIEVEGLHTYVAGGLRVHNMKAGPVALDLNGDNIVDLVGLDESKVFFDADGDGFKENIGWVGAKDGLLVIDLDGNGAVGRADEIVFTRHAPSARSDMEALGLAFDSNHDGRLDAGDTAWNKFRVWQDSNQNGVSEAGEVKTLAQLGIASVKLTTDGIRSADGGNVVKGNGSVTRIDGSTSRLADIALGYDPNGVRIDEVRSNLLIATEEDGQRKAVVRNGARASLDLGDEGVTKAEGGDGVDLFFTSKADAIHVSGGGGNDVLIGSAKGDALSGDDGTDRLSGLAGDDTLAGGDGGDSLSGGSGADTVYGDDESMVAALGGDDVIGGGADADVVYGDARTLSGIGGNDSLSGGDGDDILYGDASQLTGIGGNDVLDGGDGNDWLIGDGWGVAKALPAGMAAGDAAGADTLAGGAGDDTIIGGMGMDVAIYRGNRADYEVATTDGVTTVRDLRAVDVTGQDGVDTVTGVETLRFADQDMVIDGNSVAIARNDTDAGVVRTFSKIDKAKLLSNDVDADGDALTITAVGNGRHGFVRIDDNGDILFQAEAGYTGSAGFSYTVSDGKGGVSTAWASLEIKAPLPTDPEFRNQWHLSATHVVDVWDDFTGRGVVIGNFDGAVQYTHPDIAPNYDTVNDYDIINNDSDPLATSDGQKHSTATTGIMVAARNGTGVVGVAYDAKARVYQDVNASDTTSTSAMISAFSRLSEVDVANIISIYHSPLAINPQAVPGIDAKFSTAAANGRHGLGTIMAITGGNQYDVGNSTTLDDFTNSRFVISVGAVDPDLKRTFSTPGASTLVVAPGVGLRTDDRTGTAGYDPGDYTWFSGTCGGTPVVTGITALMLEANRNLGWRDVQEILAYSSRQVDTTSLTWDFNHAANWNGGGLHVSDDYGFGLVDARAAVRLAETWSGSHTSGNEQMVSAASGRTLSTIDQGTITDSVLVNSGLLIDHVEIDLDIDHARLGDLVVTLTSPDGTSSVLVDRPGVHRDGTGGSGEGSGTLKLTTSSVHHWGETGDGTWTLSVTDKAGGAVGTLKPWTIRLYGDAQTADDTYIFTDEFGRFASADNGTRRLISDTSGTDTINAAAISTAVTLDLRDGHVSTIAGNQLALETGTVIENAFTGDGSDIVTGNDIANRIDGGRGSDTLSGGGGNDILRGGQGDDILVGDSGADMLDGGAGKDAASYWNNDVAVSIDLGSGIAHGGNAEGDQLVSVETIWGSQHDDVLSGDGQDNVLGGFGGNDTLRGGDGSDTLIGGLGADVLDGGAGNDVASYAVSGEGVTVDLETGTAFGGDAAGDILSGIEQVWGSNFSDRITGDSGDNTLTGSEGNDTLDGGAGQDALDGGAGSDTLRGGAGWDILYGSAGADVIDGGGEQDNVVYLNSSAGISVDLGSGVAHGGDAEGDALISIEGVNGSQYADTLTGSEGGDWLWSQGGDDTLVGGSGNDTLDGGDGKDVAIYATRAVDATITKTADGWTADAGTEGVDTLKSVEELRFSDRSVWLDGRNNAVVASADRVTTTRNQGVTLQASALIANDRDFDGDQLRITAVQAIKGGAVALDGQGNVVFTPSTGFSGLGRFSYTVDDGCGGAASATVDVVVQGDNVAPVAVSSLAMAPVPGVIHGHLTAHDAEDVAGDLAFTLAIGAAHGSVVVNADGTYIYTANAGFSGEDGFSFRVTDTGGMDSTAEVNVRVAAPARYNQTFQINQYAGDQQKLPAIAAFPNGDYVITWTSAYQDGSANGIYARRYDAGGNPLGSEFQVNTTTYQNQSNSAVAVLADGSFVVTWGSYAQGDDSWGAFARRFNGDGTPASGEFHVNSHTPNEQTFLTVTKLADGGFVVTWQSNGQDGSGYGIYGQRYDGAGNRSGEEFRLNQYTSSDQYDAQVVGLQGGGFAAVWTSYGQDGSYHGVYGRIYGIDGSPRGGEFLINQYNTASQFSPVVAATSDGGFTVAWQEGYAYNGWDISIRHFTADGTSAGSNRFANSAGNFPGNQTEPSIAALSDGSVVVVWQSVNSDASTAYRYQDLGWALDFSYSTPITGNKICAIRYRPSGLADMNVTEIASFPSDESTLWSPQVVGLPGGGYAVTWASAQGSSGSADVYGKVMSAYGWPYDFPSFNVTGTWGNDVLLGGDNIDVLVGGDGDDILEGGTGWVGRDTLAGGAGNDLLIVHSSNVTVDGGGGTDTLLLNTNWAPNADLQFGTIDGRQVISNTENVIGTSGSDTIHGSTVVNTLFGGSGNDILEGRGGADLLDGGDGQDTIIYDNSSVAVFIDLGGGVGHGGDAEGDTLVGIEVVSGSAFADTLIGGGGSETLSGNAGNDFLIGSAGADSLDGGIGVDTVSYAASSTGVIVNLGTGIGSVGYAQDDRLTGIENLIGSAFADTLIGSDADNILTGGAGADTLDGGAGVDTASYAGSASGVTVDLTAGIGKGGDAEGDRLSGIEIVEGSAFDDLLSGGVAFNSTLIGGAGVDTAVFAGNWRDAAIVHGADSVQISSGNGVTFLVGVEAARFTDRTLYLDGHNNPVDARNDVIETAEGTPLVISAATLLSNDRDPDGDTLHLVSVSSANHGRVAIQDDGSVRFVPDADFCGTASFIYTLADSQGSESSATVTVTVLSQDDTFVATAVGEAFDGGGGTDSVSYAASDIGVRVDLSTGIGHGGFAEGDTLAGIENVDGSNWSDSLKGTDAVNTLGGGSGDDVLEGGSGADRLDGGAGLDTASYASSTSGVEISLVTGHGDRGDAFGDQLIGIENLNGSWFDDILVGDAGINVIVGASGNDTLIGGTGGDTLDGGDGIDTASYAGSTAGVQVDLAAQAVSDGDVLAGIENVEGSIHADHLTGDAGSNHLSGSAGDDTLIGGGGSDTLIGGTGNDVAVLMVARAGYQIARGSIGSATVAGMNGETTVISGVEILSFADGDISLVGNNAPLAVNHSLSTDEDMVLTITAASLLAGATDVDGDSLTLSGVGNAVGGTVSLDANGDVVFTPNADFNGIASFDYTVSDGHGGSSTKTVTVGVASVNDAPVAVAQTLAATEDTAQTFSASDLLAGATDVDGDALSLSGVGNAVGGTVSLDANGDVVFTPNADFNGAASFDYTIGDGQGGTATRTVMVNVAAVNDAPVALGKSASTNEDTALTISVSSLLAGATDVDGDTLTLSGVGNAVGGTVALDVNGDVVFTPDADFNGAASFDYSVSDGQGGTATRTVSVDVIGAVNHAPVAIADTLAAVEGTAMTFSVADLVSNDFDADGDTLMLVSVQNVVGGTVSIDASGDLAFQPNIGAVAAGFTYTLSDGSYSSAGNVTIGIKSKSYALTPPTRLGAEIRANTFVNNDQNQAAITALTDGGYVIVWQSAGQAQSNAQLDVYGQRYSADGMPIGAEFRVNTYLTNGQYYPDVVALSGGGFVVSWQSSTQDANTHGIYCQAYDANGVKVGGEIKTNTYSAGNQMNSAVVGLRNGGYVVSWDSAVQDGSGLGVYGQVFSSSGTPLGSEFVLNTATLNNQQLPQLAAYGDGFVGVWQSYGQDGNDEGVYAQAFSSNGAKIGSEFKVNTRTSSTQSRPAITSLKGGGFVVVWQSLGQDGSLEGIYGQRYAADGSVSGSEFAVNTITTSSQNIPYVTGLSDGGFLVGWQSNHLTDGSGFDVYARRYDTSGSAVGSEFRVNTFTLGSQVSTELAGLVDGSAIAVWASANQDTTTSWGVYAQMIDTNLTPNPTNGDDVLVGSNANDQVDGLGGNDIVIGGAGNDTLLGGAGVDTLIGGSGIDTYVFASGSGQDRVQNFGQFADGDVISFIGGLSLNDLWFSRTGNDLGINIRGTTDSIRVDDWYASSASRVSAFETSSFRLEASAVEQLVTAMATLTPPPIGQHDLPSYQEELLAPVIAGSWHAK